MNMPGYLKIGAECILLLCVAGGFSLGMSKVLEKGKSREFAQIPFPAEISQEMPNSIARQQEQTVEDSRASSQAKDELGKININTASQEELTRLRGIGPVLAERIIQYRQTFGDFKRLEDLELVQGIGPKKFDQIKDFITGD